LVLSFLKKEFFLTVIRYHHFDSNLLFAMHN
jgi:hypothetical protein